MSQDDRLVLVAKVAGAFGVRGEIRLTTFTEAPLAVVNYRDLLRKTEIREVTAELSDLAETLFVEVARRQETLLRERHGDAGPYVILALGKLGGREMSYHSDLDLVLVYAGEGRTSGARPIDHYEYFTDLARRIIKTLSHLGPMGRLYAVDMRLRPTGKSGSLVVPFGEFQRYFEARSAQIWERQSLTRSRVLHGDPAFAAEMVARVRKAAVDIPWTAEVVREIRQMRERLESSGSLRSLRRAPGELVHRTVPHRLAEVDLALQHGPHRRDQRGRALALH